MILRKGWMLLKRKEVFGLILGAVLILCSFVTVTPLAGEDATELLVNPGFEEGTFKLPVGHAAAGLDMPKGWFMNWAYWGYAEVVKDPAVAHSGKQCLMVQYRVDPERQKGYQYVNMCSDKIAVEYGKKYLVQIWVKGGKIGSPLEVAVYEYGKDRKNNGFGDISPLSPVNLSDKWQLYRAVYTPKLPELDKAIVWLTTYYEDTSPMWFDDASVRIWDGRSLLERINDSAIEKERSDRIKEVSAKPTIKSKYLERLNRIYSQVDALKASLAKDASPEAEFEGSRKFDGLVKEHQTFSNDLKVDLIMVD